MLRNSYCIQMKTGRELPYERDGMLSLKDVNPNNAGLRQGVHDRKIIFSPIQVLLRVACKYLYKKSCSLRIIEGSPVS